MNYLLVALGAAMLGAVCMHLSYKRAAFARRNERAASKAREEKERSDRLMAQAERDKAETEIQRLLQEAAHNAGWHEGYRAAQRDMEDKNETDEIMAKIDDCLINNRPFAIKFGVNTK